MLPKINMSPSLSFAPLFNGRATLYRLGSLRIFSVNFPARTSGRYQTIALGKLSTSDCPSQDVNFAATHSSNACATGTISKSGDVEVYFSDQASTNACAGLAVWSV